MSRSFKVACVQNCAGADLEASVAECVELSRQAAAGGAALVCLPEFCGCLALTEKGLEVGAHGEQAHPVLSAFLALARELRIWMLVGSVAITSRGRKFRNRSVLIDATGEVVTRYDKLHLFDVDLPNGETYRESDVIEPGAAAVIAPTPWGLLGLSVCYDLRFAYLYRSLAQAGADFLSVPAAFTRTTGEAHWHVLLRARAIETGSFVFAPCQYGRHGKAVTYGHSLIVDPWGEVLADAADGPKVIVADVDPGQVAEARRRIPALDHDRAFSEPGAMVPKRVEA